MDPYPEPGAVDADAPEEFTTTESGLKYRIRRKGDGRKPEATDTVVCNYQGTLESGKEFDSSYKRREPTEFPLNGVIPGWTEGLQLVSEGGMIELVIPPELGYGARGAGGVIPPNATLHFIVELIDVKKPPTAPGLDVVDKDAPKEFTTTDSGLKYRVLRKGDGKKPKASDSVLCHYKGSLEDGTIFDSSYQRNEPISFPLSGVIAGWTEGLQHVSEGGMIELEIPSDLGYGAAGSPPVIPANATLRFIVELIEVK